MKNSIDHIVEHYSAGRNKFFISLESAMNIACVDQKTNKFEKKGVKMRPLQNCHRKCHEVQFGLLGHHNNFGWSWVHSVLYFEIVHNIDMRTQVGCKSFTTHQTLNPYTPFACTFNCVRTSLRESATPLIIRITLNFITGCWILNANVAPFHWRPVTIPITSCNS